MKYVHNTFSQNRYDLWLFLNTTRSHQIPVLIIQGQII